MSPNTSRVPSLQRLRQRFFGISSKNASLAASVGSSQLHLFWVPSFRLAPSMHLQSPEPMRLKKLPCCVQLLHVAWHFFEHLLPKKPSTQAVHCPSFLPVVPASHAPSQVCSQSSW